MKIQKSDIMLLFSTIIVLLLLINSFFTGAGSNDAIKTFKKEQALRDSIIEAQSQALLDMSDSTRIYSEQLDSLIGVADSSLKYIESLTSVDVSKEDIDESLLWIKKYNDTL